MKKNALLLALGFVALAGAGSVQAQLSCASPGVFPGGATPTVTGTTCGGASNFGLFCGGVDSTENDVVYQFTIANPHTATNFTLTPTDPTWNPAIGLLQGGCNPNNACQADSDTGTAGNNNVEVINTVPAAAGNYFLVVTTSPGSNPNCGAFTLAANGTLPVSLQNFSVE